MKTVRFSRQYFTDGGTFFFNVRNLQSFFSLSLFLAWANHRHRSPRCRRNRDDRCTTMRRDRDNRSTAICLMPCRLICLLGIINRVNSIRPDCVIGKACSHSWKLITNFCLRWLRKFVRSVAKKKYHVYIYIKKDKSNYFILSVFFSPTFKHDFPCHPIAALSFSHLLRNVSHNKSISLLLLFFLLLILLLFPYFSITRRPVTTFCRSMHRSAIVTMHRAPLRPHVRRTLCLIIA